MLANKGHKSYHSNWQRSEIKGITFDDGSTGRIAFEVPADIQRILPVNSGADRAAIEAYVRKLVARWGTPAGGIIGLDYGGHAAIGSTPERAAWAMQAFRAVRYPPTQDGAM